MEVYRSYADYSRHRSSRSRSRSRSPSRGSRCADSHRHSSSRHRDSRHDSHSSSHRRSDYSCSKRIYDHREEEHRDSKKAKSTNPLNNADTRQQTPVISEKQSEPKPEEYEQRVQEQLACLQAEQEDEETLKEKARQRRLAIMQKHKAPQQEQQPTPLPQDTQPQQQQTLPSSPSSSLLSQPSTPASDSDNVPTSPEQSSTTASNALATSPAYNNNNNEDDFDMFDTRSRESPQRDNALLPAALEIEADSEGYCMLKLGEVLNERYKVVAYLGRGVFSQVVKCTDMQTNDTVAIKVVRNNEMMKRVGQKEIDTLQLLAQNDPDNKYCCIRFITSFIDRDFLCMVFEPMMSSLRDIINKYGKSVGLNIKAVQLYAKKLMYGLHYLRKLGIVHTDLKPENLLVDESRTGLKVADFGSSMFVNEFVNQTFPELQTGFYRSPEVLLGLPSLAHEMDMWSAGCVLYEMATGKLLFTLSKFTTSELLKSHMDLKGAVPKKLLKRGMWKSKYFDDDNMFLQHKSDALTGKDLVFPVAVSQKPTRDLLSELMVGVTGAAEKKKVTELHDLLQKCLHLNPAQRITPEEALQHPFFSA